MLYNKRRFLLKHAQRKHKEHKKQQLNLTNKRKKNLFCFIAIFLLPAQCLVSFFYVFI